MSQNNQVIMSLSSTVILMQQVAFMEAFFCLEIGQTGFGTGPTSQEPWLGIQ
jgi:hypothetical protein